jgi:hypothetical protein
MKSMMFAAALCVGTAAFAQSGSMGQTGATGTTTPPINQSTAQPGSQSGSNWGRSNSGTATGQMGQSGTSTDTSAAGSDVTGVQNGTGTTGTGMMGTGNAGAYTGMGGPAPNAGNYPPCSRSVRDSCTQGRERGVRRRPR